MDENILDLLQRDIRHCAHGIQERDPHLLTLGMERISTHSSMLADLISVPNNSDEVQVILHHLLQDLEELRKHVQAAISEGETPTVDGPIELDLKPAIVLDLRRQGLPWARIGKLFGVSRQTIYNFRVKFSIEEPNAPISDIELLAEVEEKSRQHPNSGARLIQSLLLVDGIRVSRARVCTALRTVNPVEVAVRRRQTIRRRKYKVKGANYLWSMDGTHKINMFKIVIHGCVDAFSRRVIYLHAACHNTAETVLPMFQEGVNRCHLPKRVRGDRGGENVLVEAFMNENSEVSNPFIYGRSVHNTRIERFWRDVNLQVVYVYRSIFWDLEESGDYDEDNFLDIFILHYVFLPRIKNALFNFTLQWNNHTCSTLNNRTPSQVWTVDMIKQGLYDAFTDVDEGTHTELFVVSENSLFLPDFAESFREQLFQECMRILPEPLSEDGSNGKFHYCTLKSALTSQEL